MPRKASVTDAENTVPSTPRVVRPRRKRTVSDTSDTSATSTATEVRTDEVAEAPTPTPRPRRKAPTRRVVEDSEVEAPRAVAATPSRRPGRSRLSTGIMVVVFIGAIGVSAALGFSDKGTIDVAAKIQEQSQIQANIAGEQTGGGNQVVPVQNTPVQIPNGGLRGRGAAPVPPPVEVSTTTASTTETAATTTDGVAESEVSETPSEVVTDTESSPSPTDEAPTAETQ